MFVSTSADVGKPLQLAITALVALRGGWRGAPPLVWLFNVVGTVDLVYAVFLGLSVGAQENMGAAWYIPTFIACLSG